MHSWYKRLGDFLWSEVERPPWRQRLLKLGQLVYALVRDIAAGEITLQAMSLVFTTLLAIVPLLAVSFSVLKGFGVHNQIEPLLLQMLEPMGEKGPEITAKIIGFVENVRVGVLGSVGFLLLFYSAFSLIQKVDRAFNTIWCLKKTRSLIRRLSNYLSALFIGPVLVFTSVGISASLMNSDVMQQILLIEPFGTLYRNLARLLPLLLISAAFTFLYLLIPNTKVRFSSALSGGIVSGIVWQTCSWVFALFVVSSTKYTAIYSGFAIVLFFIIWIYLNWLILLLGARLVFYLQYPGQLLLPDHLLQLSIADRERLGLRVLITIGKAYYAGEKGATWQQLNAQLKIPGDFMSEIIELLVSADLITASADQQPKYLPVCPFDTTTVKQVLRQIRQVPQFNRGHHSDHDFSKLDALLAEADTQLDAVLGQKPLKQLL